MSEDAEMDLKPFPLERIVTSSVLWYTNSVTLWASGMNTRDRIETTLWTSSTRAYSQVKAMTGEEAETPVVRKN